MTYFIEVKRAGSAVQPIGQVGLCASLLYCPEVSSNN